jgi:hypothetical protein
MSLYRAYFVPGKVDPFGLATEQEYESCVDNCLHEFLIRNPEIYFNNPQGVLAACQKSCRKRFPHPPNPLRTLGGLLALLNFNSIGGACGSSNWNITPKIIDIDKAGLGGIIKMFIPLPPAIVGNSARKCAQGYKCCELMNVTTNLNITVELVIKDLDIGAPLGYKPDVGVTIGIVGKINASVGVCVKENCKCPPKLEDRVINIKHSIDLGTIDAGVLDGLLN